MDGTHEYAVEKHDITGDGIYNIYKYGGVNPAGEISYHTIVSMAEPSQVIVDKQGGVSHTDWFDLKQIAGEAQRTLFITNTIENSVDKIYMSVQKDIDSDGSMDREVSYEIIYTNINVTTYTKEITEVKGDNSGILEEHRISNYFDSKMSQTMMFSDLVGDEPVSTRVYEDSFPNELSEVNNIENYLIPAIHTSLVGESGSPITSQTPNLDGLFYFSHSTDNVPAEFDQKTSIENGEITTENILSVTQTISIPGVYSESGQGFDSYTVDAIQSVPSEGTYWINSPNSLPAKDEEGYYLFFNSGNDGVYETVFVLDKDGKVVGIGFDYDQDSRFLPGKTVPVRKDILRSNDYRPLDLSDDYIHFEDFDHEVGVFNEPTFTDVLFDVVKMDFRGSSDLIELAKSMATDQFNEEVTFLSFAEDIFQQVVASMAGIGLGMVTTSGPVGFMLGYLSVSLGFQMHELYEQEQFINHLTFYKEGSERDKILGSKFWFDDMYGDVMTNSIFGSVDGVYAPVYTSTDLHSYSGDVVLREYNFFDPKILPFTTSFTVPKLDYCLSTRNLAGYSDFDDHFITDFLHEEGILNLVLRFFGPAEYNHAESSVYYLENQIKEETSDNGDMYLDTIIPTIDYTDDKFSPRLSFADSTGSFPTPEFYTPYPVFTSEDSSILDEYCSIYKLIPMDHPEEVTSIEVQLFDGDIGLKSDIISVNAYIAWSNRDQADELASIPGRSPNYINTLDEDDFAFDPATGMLTVPLNPKLARVLNALYYEIQRVESEPDSSGCSYYVIFQVKVEKYRSIDDLRDLTSEQVNKIAAAQAIEASILEYNYQFNLATQTQLSYHEIIYTIGVTAISTAITMGASIGIGKFAETVSKAVSKTTTAGISKYGAKVLSNLLQPAASFSGFNIIGPIAKAMVKESLQEIFLDPWIEASVSGLVRRAGGDEIMQMVLSSVAESLRETVSGPFTKLFSSSGTQSEGTNLFDMLDYKYFKQGLQPTMQDILNNYHDFQAEIRTQQQMQKEYIKSIGVSMRTLGFFLNALSFGMAQFLGPAASMIYTTLKTYCYTEEISLKGVFNKVFNSVNFKINKHDRRISDSRTFAKLDLEGFKFSRLLASSLHPRRIPGVHLLDNYNPNFNSREDPRYSNPIHRTLYLIEALRYSIRDINSLGTSKKVTDKKFVEVFELNKKYISARRKDIRDGVDYKIGSDLLLDFKIILSSINGISERKFDFAIRAIKSYQDFYRIPEVYSQHGVEEQNFMLNLRKAFTPSGKRLIPVHEIERLLEYGRGSMGRGIFGLKRSLSRIAAETYLQKLVYKIWKSDYKNLDKISAYSAITNYALKKGYNEARLRTYYVPPDAANHRELEIIAILKAAYSKHDIFRSARNEPTMGKLISNELLYETILGKGKGNLLRNIIDSGRPIPVRLLNHIMKIVVKRDKLYLIAFGEFTDLYKALHKYSPLFMVRYKQDYQYYYDVTEKSFSIYLKSTQVLVNDYAPGFDTDSVRRTQRNILLDQLGGRDAMTGELVRDPITNKILKRIIRHHFKISNRFNKMDCRISALVPLTSTSHGVAHTPLWEQRFSTLKWFVERGLPFIPSWWSKQNQKDYAVYLKKLGML